MHVSPTIPSTFSIIWSLEGVLQVNHADVWAGLWINMGAGSVTVEDGRERNSDMRRTPETGFTVTFSKDADLGNKIQRLRRCR